MEYEVGKFYKIPHIWVLMQHKELSNSHWVPILFPAHEDNDLVAGIGIHFHYDFRFTLDFYPNMFSKVRSVLISLGDIEIKHIRKKCRRQMPQNYPHHLTKWFGKLQKQYKCAKLKNGICPHRGVDLTGCGDSEKVVCPAHGLTWNKQTGELIELTNWAS